MPENLFEKIFPKEKPSLESKEIEKPSLESKEIEIEKNRIEGLVKPETPIIEEKMNQIETNLFKFDEKIRSLQDKIRHLEKSISTIENFEKTRGLETFVQEIYDKLNQIEEIRAQLFIQNSKIQTKYMEMNKRFDDVEYILERMESLEKMLPIVDKLQVFGKEIELLRESIEKIKLSLVEQKFYSLVAIIPKVTEKEILINLLDELDRTIEELKKNDMYRYDKIVLSSNVLKNQNVKELKVGLDYE